MKNVKLVITIFAMLVLSGGFTSLVFAPPGDDFVSAQCPICFENYLGTRDENGLLKQGQKDLIVLQFDCDQSIIHHCCLQCAKSSLNGKLQMRPPQPKECCFQCRAPLKIFDPRVEEESCERIHHRYEPLSRAAQDELDAYLLLDNHEISNKPARDTVERTCFSCTQEIERGKVILELGCGHTLCLADAEKMLSENKEKCPVCNKGPIILLDPLEKKGGNEIALKYLYRPPTNEELAIIEKVRSYHHIKVSQDHVFPRLRVPVKKISASLELVVDTTRPEYKEFTDFLKQIDALDNQIALCHGVNRDSEDLRNEKSRVANAYIAKLKQSAQYYYQGDNLWYYLRAKNLLNLEHICTCVLFGYHPVIPELIFNKVRNGVGLQCSFVHLLSFQQSANIAAFAVMANAAALQGRITAGETVGFAQIRKRAEANIEKIKSHRAAVPEGIECTAENLVDVAKVLNLPQDTFEILDKSIIEKRNARLQRGEHVIHAAQFMKKLTQHKVMHVLYETDDSHWVLVSCVKTGNTVTIYLLDSLNRPLSPDSNVVALLKYFRDIFNQNYDLGVDRSARSLEFLNRYVDKNKPAYQEYLDTLKRIEELDDLIELNRDEGKDVGAIVAERSSVGQTYLMKLHRNNGYYYHGDDLWYRRMIFRGDVSLLQEDRVHGPVLINPMIDFYDAPRLVHLLSFESTSSSRREFVALANAAAVQRQIDAKTKITFADTRKFAEANFEKIQSHIASVRTIENFVNAARVLNLPRGTLEVLDKSTFEKRYTRLLQGERVVHAMQFMKKLAQHKVMHVIYNAGDVHSDHWILVSCVKAGNTITMYLLDTLNKPLSPDGDVVALLSYFRDIFKQNYNIDDCSARSLEFLNRYVDKNKPAYQEYLETLKRIEELDDLIELNKDEGKDVTGLLAEKSGAEDAYRAILKGRARHYYQGDDLWYYHMIMRPRDIECMGNHFEHGFVFSQLDTKEPLSDLGLGHRFVHLISFEQTNNISGFAAMANAAAIQQQIDAKMTISFADTRRLAELKVGTVEGFIASLSNGIDKACVDDFAEAAKVLNLQRDTFEFLDKATFSAHNARWLKGERGDHVKQFESKFTQHKVRHIIYNTGTHWVLVSLVKTGNTSTLYLLDSLNRPLSLDSDVVALLRYVNSISAYYHCHEATVCVAPSTGPDDLQEIRFAPSKESFEGALKKLEPRLYIKLLKELVTDFVDASLDQKNLVSEKIALCAQEIRLNSHISSLPSQTGDFFAAQVKNSTQPWPQEFKALVGAYNTYQAIEAVKKRSSSWKKYVFTGALIGAVAYAGYLYWLQGASEKKEADQSDAPHNLVSTAAQVLQHKLKTDQNNESDLKATLVPHKLINKLVLQNLQRKLKT